MLLEAVSGRGLVFTGGKGGVGKTTTAAALAAASARSGARTLLVSTDPAHNLGHIFEREIGPRPRRIAENLSALELDPDETVKTHLDQVGATLRRLMPPESGGEVARHMDRARHAPGMAEAALLDRLAVLVQQIGREHDRLIVDTAPTGHTLALLSLPEMMTAWTDGLLANRAQSDRFAARARALAGGDARPPDRNEEIRAILGRRREKLAGLRARLTDPARTAFVLVTTPERMPVMETASMAAALSASSIKPGALVVNRVPEALLDEALAERLEPLMRPLSGLPRFILAQLDDEPMGLHALTRLAGRARRLS